MSVTPLFSVPWGMLANKKEAKLAGGAISRGHQIDHANRSAYNTTSGTTMLGMGYAEAVLAVLHGIVGTIMFDADAMRGRVTMRSTGGPTAYEFSWLAEPSRVVYGGFGHSEGQPTYQAAIVGLAELVARHRTAPASQSREVVERWYALIGAMETAHPRANRDAGWDKRTLEAACADPGLRAHIERVADALYYAMRFRLEGLPGDDLPPLRERGLVVTAPDVLRAGEGRATRLPGSLLLQPDALASRGAPDKVPETPIIDASEHSTADAGAAVETDGDATDLRDVTPASAPAARRKTRTHRAASVAPATTATPDAGVSPATETAPVARKVYGPHAARVQRALRASGDPLFLSGPTATGKTTLAIQAAEALGMGIEIVVFDPGMDAQELFGGYARTTTTRSSTTPSTDVAGALTTPSAATSDTTAGTSAIRVPAWASGLLDAVRSVQTDVATDLALMRSELATVCEGGMAATDGDWQAVDGPLTRWGRRAMGGEKVLLILDELARGHESCISAVMRALNTYDAQTVRQQGLCVPPESAANERFHILDVWMTKERLVVPTSRVKIVATANLGDRYTGLDLSDPAFRRRWSGGWLHLGAHAPDTLGEILSDWLGMPGTSPLIARMKTVATQVEQYQRSEDVLNATLDLATLITWGQVTLALTSLPGVTPGLAFTEAAVDVWVERICPIKGNELDPDVRSKLLGWVSANAPSTLR